MSKNKKVRIKWVRYVNFTILLKKQLTVEMFTVEIINWFATYDCQQCGILTGVDSDEPVQPPYKPRHSK